MDYLKWELERQRSALGALLTGGEVREGETAPDGEGRSPAGLGAAESAAWPSGRYAGGGIYTAVFWRGVPGTEETLPGTRRDFPAEGDGGLAPPEDLEAPPLAGGDGFLARAGAVRPLQGAARAGTGPRTPRRGGTAEAPESGAGPQAETRSPAAESAGKYSAGRGGVSGGGEAAGGIAVPMGGAERALTASRWGGPWGGGGTVLLAEDGARLLSRAVQRDARRYDGGFTRY